MSSLSEELTVFFLTGPEATKSLSLAGCNASPKAGNTAEWVFEGRKVCCISRIARQGGQYRIVAAFYYNYFSE